jgi:sugar/nucleoside kinase (ribokinase family)
MLTEANVDPNGLSVSPGRDTSQTLIVNVSGQDRRFIHTFGANADFTAADIPADFGGARALYVGGFFVMDRLDAQELARVFAAARQAGVKTVLDVVTPGPGRDYLAALRPLLPQTDLFLPNTDEARLITGQSDPLKQASLFHELGAGTVVITCGGDGAILVNAHERLRADVYPITFLDASGGGDAFDAGYIVGLLRGLPTEDCLRLASALGASCVRAIGTTPGVFTRDECDAFMRAHPLTVQRV